jgi:hypothetical protein
MDAKRKAAYRNLLYWACLDMRQAMWLPVRWWSPVSWYRGIKEMRRVGALADALHNLALFSVHEFERFDEDWFWREVEGYEQKHFDNGGNLRRIFDAKMTESTGTD